MALKTFFVTDSVIPVVLCLVVEKCLAKDTHLLFGISTTTLENVGMVVHVINIIVVVLIPMVFIHVRGHTFSLGKCPFKPCVFVLERLKKIHT